MPYAVAHLFELVEYDHVVTGVTELPGLIEYLFYVGLAAGGSDDFAGDLGEPIKAFLAHFGGQYGYAVAGKELGVEGAAAAVVAGRGPNGLIVGSVELSGHEAGYQAAIGSADLMTAGGEPLADHDDDPGLYAGQAGGDLDEVYAAIGAALHSGLVMPGDAEQVQRIYVPQADLFEAFLYLLGNQIRILHLGEGGEYDLVLACDLNVVLELFVVFFEIDHFTPHWIDIVLP